MMLEVDETFTAIWLSRSSEVRSVSGDDLSPLSGLFFGLMILFFQSFQVMSNSLVFIRACYTCCPAVSA